MQWVIEQIGLRWISELTQSPQPSPGSMMIDPKPEKVFKGWYPDWAAQNYPDGAPRESALSYGKSEKPPDFSLSKFSVHLIFQGLPRRHTPLDLPWPQVLTCAIWSVLLWPSTLFCKRKKGGAVLAPGNSWGWDKRLGREWVRRVWGWRGWGEGGRGFRDPQPQGRKKWGFCSEDSGTMFPLLIIYTPGLRELFRFSDCFDTFLAHGPPNMLFALLRKLTFFSYHLAAANASFISQLKCHLKWQWPCLTVARVTSYQILLNLLLLFLGGPSHGRHKWIACMELLYFQRLIEPRYFHSILKLKNKCKN